MNGKYIAYKETIMALQKVIDLKLLELIHSTIPMGSVDGILAIMPESIEAIHMLVIYLEHLVP